MIESNTMVRNGAPFIGPALESVLPYVKRAIVLLDDSSTDDTGKILDKLQRKHDNLYVEKFKHPKHLSNLTSARNRLLELSEEEWVLILDDDEVYPREVMERLIEVSESNETKSLVAYRSWFVIDMEHIHKVRSSKWIPRLVRREGVKWRRNFGEESLFKGKTHLWESDDITELHDIRYLHFSYMKKDSWRKDFDIPYPKNYSPIHESIGGMPDKIISKVKKIYEKM